MAEAGQRDKHVVEVVEHLRNELSLRYKMKIDICNSSPFYSDGQKHIFFLDTKGNSFPKKAKILLFYTRMDPKYWKFEYKLF